MSKNTYVRWPEGADLKVRFLPEGELEAEFVTAPEHQPEAVAKGMLARHGYAKAYQRAGEYALDAKYSTPPRPVAQAHWEAVAQALTLLQMSRT